MKAPILKHSKAFAIRPDTTKNDIHKLGTEVCVVVACMNDEKNPCLPSRYPSITRGDWAIMCLSDRQCAIKAKHSVQIFSRLTSNHLKACFHLSVKRESTHFPCSTNNSNLLNMINMKYERCQHKHVNIIVLKVATAKSQSICF